MCILFFQTSLLDFKEQDFIIYGAKASSADSSHSEDLQPIPEGDEENVSFSSSVPAYSLDLTSSPDPTFAETGTPDCGISGFLGRYVSIASFEWDIGSDMSVEMDAWTKWQINPRIAEKLKHFRHLKCDLELKVYINGTPFHYGMLMMAYSPMHPYWARNFDTPAVATAQRANSPLYNMMHYQAGSIPLKKQLVDSYFSTFPHVMLSPSDNNPMHMVLPFIWHNNYLRINNRSSLYSDGNSGVETPGWVVFRDINSLAIANDDTSRAVNIHVFARAINIDVNTPTAAVASSETLEAKDGFVSKIASTTATVAKVAQVIPVLAPFAKATEVAAEGVGAVASLFGFSKPANPAPSDNFGINNARNVAVTNVGDNSQRLTFDAHQELTVDSRVIGADGCDEMTYVAINSKWYLCGSAPWIPIGNTLGSTSRGFDAATPQLLWNSLVSPMYYRTSASTGAATEMFVLNPAGYLANTFRYWRGSLVYRIQVVASRFHSGRIKIQFDPFNTDPDEDDIETRFTWIMDLTEAREMEVTIPFTSYRGFLKVPGLKNNQNSGYPPSKDITVNGLPAEFEEGEHMGVFSVSIVNHLVSPSPSNNNVHINIWQKCGDDMEYQVPSTGWHSEGILNVDDPAALREVPEIFSAKASSEDGANVVPDDAPVGGPSQPKDLWSTGDTPQRNLVWFGERTLSIRALMKRFNYVTSMKANFTGNNPVMAVTTIPHFPEPSRVTSDRYNSYLGYFSPCYLAKRGGTRFKIYDRIGAISSSAKFGSHIGAVQLERRWNSSYIPAGVTLKAMNTSSSATTYDREVAGGTEGGLLAGDGLGDKLVEAESPYYSSNRFELGMYTGSALSPIDEGANSIRYTALYNGLSNHNVNTSYYQAAAEDCALMYFLAAPPLYKKVL